MTVRAMSGDRAIWLRTNDGGFLRHAARGQLLGYMPVIHKC